MEGARDDARTLRLLFYCHNVHGLGHIVRSLQIASAAAGEGCRCTVVTGCRALDEIELDQRLDVQRLPPVRLVNSTRLVAVDSELAGTDVMKLRSERILEICRAVRPHATLVDYNPLGLAGELCPALDVAASEHWGTRFIWGIPYVEGGFQPGQRPRNPVIARAFARYHSVIAYVDPGYEDLFSKLPSWIGMPNRAYMGFVVQPPPPPAGRKPGLAAVICGGGVRAASFCRFVLAARRRASCDVQLRFVLGPLADVDGLEDRLRSEPLVEVWRTGTVIDAIRDAALVISRAGYNTASMLMQTDLPVIFVPGLPDQAYRAERLSTQPGIWHVEEQPGTEPRLAELIDTALGSGPVSRNLGWSTDGAKRAAQWMITAAKERRTTGSGGF
jgi:predicted glycosyltransferase